MKKKQNPQQYSSIQNNFNTKNNNSLFNTQNPFEITSYDKIQEQLKKQGYCFIELPVHLQKSSSTAFNLSKQFFDNQWDNNNPQYQQLFAPPQYGYQKTQYKQSFTILTGKMLEKQDKALQQLIPDQNIQQALKQNAFDFDNFAEIILNFLPEITKNNQFFKEVPLANEKERYGMIDIVQYKNELEHKVLPHIDPGIIAISVLSDTKGLSFYNNNTNTWVDGPVNQPKIGVIWTGLKTMELNNQFQGGVHQVLPSLGNLRTTIWYEVIIRDQVSQEVQENGMLANKIVDEIQEQNQQQNLLNQLYYKDSTNRFNENNNNDSPYSDVTQMTKQELGQQYNVTILLDQQPFIIKCHQLTTLGDLKYQMEEKSGMRYSKIAFNLSMLVNGRKIVPDKTQLVDLGFDKQDCPHKITMNKVIRW